MTTYVVHVTRTDNATGAEAEVFLGPYLDREVAGKVAVQLEGSLARAILRADEADPDHDVEAMGPSCLVGANARRLFSILDTDRIANRLGVEPPTPEEVGR